MKSILAVVAVLILSQSVFASDLSGWAGLYESNCDRNQVETFDVTFENGTLRVGADLIFDNLNAGKQVTKINTETGYIRKVVDTQFDGAMVIRSEKSVNYQGWVLPTDQFQKEETLMINAADDLEYKRVINEDSSSAVVCTFKRMD